MTQHRVNDERWNREMRLGWAVFSKRYYLLVRFGEERRDAARLAKEGQVQLPTTAVAFGTAGLATLALVFTIGGFLFVGSATGLFGDTTPRAMIASFFE